MNQVNNLVTFKISSHYFLEYLWNLSQFNGLLKTLLVGYKI